MAESAESAEDAATEDERWLVIGGRRWRRTDPSLPEDVVMALKSHLGRGRSGVGAAKRHGDEPAVAASRERVGLAKHGLGERGPYWWEEPVAARLARAHEALEALTALDEEETDAEEDHARS
ncbi:biopolymer transporter Tol [Herbiconiux liukaitaii]|uniref:biopolymer transporter Tol n=1 Tax=Herbiconiux liukaitaii TaxID=3342799 RepID=UPI0035BA9DA8